MRGLLKTFGNAAFVVVGFFAVLFGVSRVPLGHDNSQAGDAANIGVAYADIPYAQGSYGCGDSGDCAGLGGGDCGSCGCDGGK